MKKNIWGSVFEEVRLEEACLKKHVLEVLIETLFSKSYRVLGFSPFIRGIVQ